MGRLTKEQTKLHNQARELISLSRDLRHDERLFVAENWDPVASHNITASSAFFTPRNLAEHLAIETLVCDSVTLDLCAGIGSISLAVLDRYHNSKETQLICIERENIFYHVGKRIVPEAKWINCDVFKLLDAEFVEKNLPEFKYKDVEFISNPPFGAIPKDNRNKCVGRKFEYAVAEIGMRFASTGTMIVADGVTPWRYSGKQGFTQQDNPEYQEWSNKTDIVLEPNCGIDTTLLDAFKHTKVVTEITNVYRKNAE